MITTAAAAAEYLVVDRYLESLVGARALKTAFETGLVDLLVQRRSAPLHLVERATGTDPQGLGFLLDLLESAGVVERALGDVRLAPAFAGALRFRDLLEVKLDYAGYLLDDFADHFTTLIREPQRFAGQARLFELFDYRRALQASPENYARTRAWMRLTSALTRHEARAALVVADLAAHRRLLDVGGNSGEFSLQACKRHPGLQATVFDLPLVCEIGLEHVLVEPEAPRIAFRSGDLRADPLPPGHDIVVFKSMLHDWPLAEAEAFLAKAAQALAPGGTLLIFERSAIDVRRGLPRFADLPLLLFFRSYRGPDAYVAALQKLGLREIEVRTVELDSPFLLLTARKPRP